MQCLVYCGDCGDCGDCGGCGDCGDCGGSHSITITRLMIDDDVNPWSSDERKVKSQLSTVVSKVPVDRQACDEDCKKRSL